MITLLTALLLTFGATQQPTGTEEGVTTNGGTAVWVTGKNG